MKPRQEVYFFFLRKKRWHFSWVEEEKKKKEWKAIVLREVKRAENRKNVQKWSTSQQQETRESEEEKCNRHKSKQMFNSLKRTAKIPPNGLIKWQDLHFFQQGTKQNFNSFLISCVSLALSPPHTQQFKNRLSSSQCNEVIYVRKCCFAI